MISRGSPRFGRIRRFTVGAATLVLGLSAAILAIGGLIGVSYFFFHSLIEYVPPSAVLSAAGLATLGWLVAAGNQRSLSRKQHTLNLLIQMRHADAYNRQIVTILKSCPTGKKLNPRQLDLLAGRVETVSEEDRAFVQAVIYVLNYWEFVCAALVVGDLDAELVRRTVRQHIVGFHDKFAAMIDEERANGQTLVFQHLRITAEAWRGVK